jgi:hypothetical protein
MTLVKMTNKSFNPIGIGLFGTQTIMFEAYLATHLLQQTRRQLLHLMVTDSFLVSTKNKFLNDHVFCQKTGFSTASLGRS